MLGSVKLSFSKSVDPRSTLEPEIWVVADALDPAVEVVELWQVVGGWSDGRLQQGLLQVNQVGNGGAGFLGQVGLGTDDAPPLDGSLSSSYPALLFESGSEAVPAALHCPAAALPAFSGSGSPGSPA